MIHAPACLTVTRIFRAVCVFGLGPPSQVRYPSVDADVIRSGSGPTPTTVHGPGRNSIRACFRHNVSGMVAQPISSTLAGALQVRTYYHEVRGIIHSSVGKTLWDSNTMRRRSISEKVARCLCCSEEMTSLGKERQDSETAKDRPYLPTACATQQGLTIKTGYNDACVSRPELAKKRT